MVRYEQSMTIYDYFIVFQELNKNLIMTSNRMENFEVLVNGLLLSCSTIIHGIQFKN